jgi:hypothetical protein
MNYLDQHDKSFLDSVEKSSELKRYYNFYDYIKSNINKLAENPNYFLENPVARSNSIRIQLTKKFYYVTDKLIAIFKLRGLIFKTDIHFSRFREMD